MPIFCLSLCLFTNYLIIFWFGCKVVRVLFLLCITFYFCAFIAGILSSKVTSLGPVLELGEGF